MAERMQKMQNSLDRTGRRVAKVIRRLKAEQSGEIPMDVGFPFSAWFFVAVVALSFLDAYIFNGKGIEIYFSVPTDVLAHSRSGRRTSSGPLLLICISNNQQLSIGARANGRADLGLATIRMRLESKIFMVNFYNILMTMYFVNL
jgi:hypothetical protein